MEASLDGLLNSSNIRNGSKFLIADVPIVLYTGTPPPSIIFWPGTNAFTRRGVALAAAMFSEFSAAAVVAFSEKRCHQQLTLSRANANR
mmetsp:Transcript_23894/g.51227  ORF Transcript_23894/g.51227 Transcript_23894/m.51227 type:complete len:89 (+) Transcript_23894:755-1021(+)